MFFSVLLAALSIVVLDGKEISKRLVGGTPAELGEFPWMARLLRGQPSTFVCGAVMIHPRVALTAAHCVCYIWSNKCGGIAEYITLQVGGERIDGKDALHEILVHPDNIAVFGGRPNFNDKDFAVIILNDQNDDTLNCTTSTISLPNSSPLMEESEEECYALGWGFSGDCMPEPPTKYDACGGKRGVVSLHYCTSLGCCHYKALPSLWPRICYFYEGQCKGISYQPCRHLVNKNKMVTEAECHEYGCCYNKSRGETGECYDNSNIENQSKKVLEKAELYGWVDESGVITVHYQDSRTINSRTVRGPCVGDSGGPYVCRKLGTKVWKLYGIVNSVNNCGVYSRYWNVFKSLDFIMSVVPKDVAEDLKAKAGLS